MKIISLLCENVKRLKVVEIKPDGSLVVIGGRNGQGKSSTLDAIEFALGGKDHACRQPVRRGEKKSRIVIKTDSGLTVSRTYTEAGGGTLTVENSDGAVYKSPQSMLDALVGTLTFDPLEFTRMPPAKQVETLRRIVGLDFTESDTTRAQVYTRRTEVNRDADRLKSQLASMPNYPDVTEEVSVDALMKEYRRRSDLNEENRRARELVAEYGRAATATASFEERAYERQMTVEKQRDLLLKDSEAIFAREMQEIERRIARAREDKSQREASIKADADKAVSAARSEWEKHQQSHVDFEKKTIDARNTAEALVDQSVAEIQEKMAAAGQINQKFLQNRQRAQVAKTLADTEASSRSLTESLAAIDEDKREKLAAANFPVAGLSFDETGVLFNSIPFDQCSSAEQLRVSVAIGLAANPKLRVMLVREGSLLDDDSLKLLAELAEQNDGQVWLEKVGTEGNPTVIIEDGMVVGAEVAQAE